MKPFWALRIHDDHGDARLQQIQRTDLTPGEVTIEVHYSSVNYKDALAGTGRGKILKSYPLNAGIDASGIVIDSIDPRFQSGQKVIVTGCGIGENTDGGFSEVLRVAADAVVPLPPGVSMKEAMILGTAGFTAALALHRLEQNGQRPEMGPILISGASGGVGSFATQLFSQKGYEVHAMSGKHEAIRYLQKLGAKKVLTPDEVNLGKKPLETVRYGGAVDNVGGEFLSHLIPHIQLYGSVASVGLTLGAELKGTVMPYILRGVSLIGISSNNCPRDLRHILWRELAGAWRPRELESLVARTIEMEELVQAFDDLIHRKVHGRILVEIRK